MFGYMKFAVVPISARYLLTQSLPRSAEVCQNIAVLITST